MKDPDIGSQQLQSIVKKKLTFTTLRKNILRSKKGRYVNFITTCTKITLKTIILKKRRAVMSFSIQCVFKNTIRNF